MSVERMLRNMDVKVALALTKRDNGEQLTRAERRLLAFEESGMTPEEQARILTEVARRPARGAMARVAAINAAGSLTGDMEKADDSKSIEIRVSLAALWAAPPVNSAGGPVNQLRSTEGQVIGTRALEEEPESIREASARILGMEKTRRDNARRKRRTARRRSKSRSR